MANDYFASVMRQNGFVSLERAAEILGVTLEKVYEMILSFDLPSPSLCYGRRWLRRNAVRKAAQRVG
jgi:hypothetical protein